MDYGPEGLLNRPCPGTPASTVIVLTTVLVAVLITDTLLDE